MTDRLWDNVWMWCGCAVVSTRGLRRNRQAHLGLERAGARQQLLQVHANAKSVRSQSDVSQMSVRCQLAHVRLSVVSSPQASNATRYPTRPRHATPRHAITLAARVNMQSCEEYKKVKRTRRVLRYQGLRAFNSQPMCCKKRRKNRRWRLRV